MVLENILGQDGSVITYEERIVAFIDILAFRTLVNETVKDEQVDTEGLVNLIKVLALIKDEFTKVTETGELPYSFEITYFSDTVVFSIPKHNNIGLLTLFECLKRIQIKLIQFEVLLRGGVVVGKLIHRPGFILGPAMMAAYDLESKSAVYPRITIDPDVMEMSVQEHELQDGLFSIKDFDYQKTFELDFDSTFYINYFSDVIHYLEDGDLKRYYQQLRRMIRNGVRRKDIGIRMKYMWMLNKFNSGKPMSIQEMSYKELDYLNEKLEKM